MLWISIPFKDGSKSINVGMVANPCAISLKSPVDERFQQANFVGKASEGVKIHQ